MMAAVDGGEQWVRVQRADQTEDLVVNGSNADDDILACAVHYHRHVAPGRVLLLTGDKALRLKASAYDIESQGLQDFLDGPHGLL